MGRVKITLDVEDELIDVPAVLHALGGVLHIIDDQWMLEMDNSIKQVDFPASSSYRRVNTLYDRYGNDFFRKIGQKGGQASMATHGCVKGFRRNLKKESNQC